MKPQLALVALLAASGLLAAEPGTPQPAAVEKLPDGLYAEFVTPRGIITAELYYTKAPLTVTNFVGLAEGKLGPKKGAPFFNGLKFHRVVPNFVVQGGDPLNTGQGGPDYSFPDEFVPGLRHDAAGVLSMANSGPDTNGSQFFITLREVNRLNYLHSVFGRVVRGLDVLSQIQQGDVMTAVNIRRIGPAAAAFPADQASFDRLAAAAKRAVVPFFDDPEQLLPTEPPRARNFQFKLANFERATGTPLYARVYSKFTPAKPTETPGNQAQSLAKELKLPPTAVLALYFADIGKWGLWIGDGQLARFVGHPGTLAELMKDGALHHAKQDFLAAAKTLAEEYTAEAAKAAPPDKPLTDGQKIKYQVDAVLDGLINKFEPQP